jgi:hypothetical protein
LATKLSRYQATEFGEKLRSNYALIPPEQAVAPLQVVAIADLLKALQNHLIPLQVQKTPSIFHYSN